MIIVFDLIQTDAEHGLISWQKRKTTGKQGSKDFEMILFQASVTIARAKEQTLTLFDMFCINN